MSQPTLFGPAEPEPFRQPTVKMPWDRPGAPMAIIRGRSTRCRDCGAEIVFALVAKHHRDGSESIKNMPVDVDPDPGGTVHLGMEGRQLRGWVIGRKEDRAGRDNLHISHMSSCPERDRYKKGGHR